MKFLKHKIAILSLVLVSMTTFMSCEDNDSGITIIGLEAGFIAEINSKTVTFINVSSNATSFSWDFGNNTSSTNSNPVVTYVPGEYTVTLTARDDEGNSSQSQQTITIDNEQVINGGFESGITPWLSGVTNPIDASSIVEVNGNSYYSVNVTNPNPMQPFLINLSQILEIIEGSTYQLVFDAWSDGNRTLIAGIGLSDGDFSNTVETVDLTTTPTTFTLTLTATGFGAANARVLFDSNGAAGMVNIDNVSLREVN